MIRRIVLHIGRHKTGTSAIQRYLADNRAAYADEGVIIPEFGGGEEVDSDLADRVAHHQLALAFAHGTTATPAEHMAWQNALQDAVKGGHTLVLTSEVFQNCTDFSALRRLCQDFYVEVVCYLREYLDYALSAYAQEIKKNGLIAGFYEFEHTFAPSLGNFLLRWEEFANRCHWQFYDRNRFIEGDVVQDFLMTVGLPDFGGNRYRDENPRIGGSLLGFKLLANAAGLHSRALGRALEPLAAERSDFRLPWRLKPEMQSILRSRREYNAVLVDLFGTIDIRDVSAGALPFDSRMLADDFRSIIVTLDDFPALRSHPLFKAFLERT